MSGFTSKFRHIWGDCAKQKDSYSDIKNALTSGESQYVKANARFLAYGKTAGGAPIYVRLLSNPGRTAASPNYVATHKGKLTDFDFHPFIDNMIATAGDDCKVNINKFPKEGLTEKVTKAENEIKGHRKKISLILFNPSANSIIASASYDRTVKIFNIENAATVATFDQCQDNIYSMAWNRDGSMLAVTGKDKCLRVYDPRKADDAITINEAFGGIKSSKCFFVNAFGWVGSTGFSKTAKRELKIWDPRNTEKPVYAQGLDNQASVLCPHVDDDLNILYLAGKGDNSVSYYELRNDDKVCHYLSLYRDSVPQKGGGWVFKRGLDVMKCEVQRFLKLTKEAIIPISFVVPRKSGGDVFQEDIFPPCVSGKPGLSADEWSAGNNADPPTMSMDPDDRKDMEDGDDEVQFTKQATYDDVVAENMQLKQRVKQLEDEVAALKAQLGGGDAADGGNEQAADADAEQ
eukprot:CAMPEP_0197026456 /NCGR_PEP_ID=MMETSP1384-20130603/6533_1 /TAXON_ID=29189 /ORGANISM="Ammonia sp." /LENGTH=460 /DNA_ID=CAMNT_0042455121 /DNA_START=158 /DNA_END=1540 /DNA_ORIENTATION=+